jgi:ATP-dependent DNA helicase RecG
LLGIDNASRNVGGTQAFQNHTDIEYWLFSICKFRVDVHEVQHPDGRVIAFEIPPRPIGHPYEVDGQYLIARVYFPEP